jgi:hypothetical protein
MSSIQNFLLNFTENLLSSCYYVFRLFHLHFVTQIIIPWLEYKVWSSSVCNFLHPPDILTLLDPNILLWTLSQIRSVLISSLYEYFSISFQINNDLFKKFEILYIQYVTHCLVPPLPPPCVVVSMTKIRSSITWRKRMKALKRSSEVSH